MIAKYTPTSSEVELINTIVENPVIYIGRKSIFGLQMFIHGWSFRNVDTVTEWIQKDFTAWVRKKYEIKSEQSWASIIFFFSTGDEDALNNFCTLWKQFIATKESAAD